MIHIARIDMINNIDSISGMIDIYECLKYVKLEIKLMNDKNGDF